MHAYIIVGDRKTALTVLFGEMMPALNTKSVVTWKDVLLTFNWVVRKWWTGLKEFLNSATVDVFAVADANFVNGVLAYLPRDWVVEGSIPGRRLGVLFGPVRDLFKCFFNLEI